MKKTIQLFTLLTLAFISCKKNSGDVTIDGKWVQSSMRLKNQYTDNGSVIFSEDTTSYFSHGEYTKFNSDGTYSSGSDTSTVINRGTYISADNKITMVSNYSYQGQQIHDTSVYDIKQLGSTSLNLYNNSVQNVNPGTLVSEIWIELKR